MISSEWWWGGTWGGFCIFSGFLYDFLFVCVRFVVDGPFNWVSARELLVVSCWGPILFFLQCMETMAMLHALNRFVWRGPFSSRRRQMALKRCEMRVGPYKVLLLEEIWRKIVSTMALFSVFLRFPALVELAKANRIDAVFPDPGTPWRYPNAGLEPQRKASQTWVLRVKNEPPPPRLHDWQGWGSPGVLKALFFLSLPNLVWKEKFWKPLAKPLNLKRTPLKTSKNTSILITSFCPGRILGRFERSFSVC